MRIVSWNVNGLRALIKKGIFPKFLDSSGADVITFQETKVREEQLPLDVLQLEGWHSYYSSAERLGYSGVALFSRRPADEVISSLPIAQFNDEGRYLVARFGDIHVASIYFPNGSGKNRDNSRVPYKLDFYDCVKNELNRMRETGPTFVTGDFNTAHTELDLARPKANSKTSGFLLEEREAFEQWLEESWIDVFRAHHPNEPDHYTWWRQWGNSRENNVGWRIDYVLASSKAAALVTKAFHWPNVYGSDHCPIGIDCPTVNL
ncbi:MAG: exodeoxyribonuclease III [Gammaproteobacteria bacterium]|nr:exodeoxyribonuclease III [Gammaproteobacteria bacterium]